MYLILDRYIYLYIYHILFRHIACSPIKWRHIIKVPPIIVWATLLCHPQLMSAPPQQSSLSSFESAAAARGTAAGGGLAGPTNNDVCLNGGGAALTLYTPCQFPPVRQPVNCCRDPLARISSHKSTGFLRLSPGFAVTSRVKAIFGLFDTCQWVGGSCHRICQIEPKQLKCRHPEILVAFDNWQRLSPVVVKWLWATWGKWQNIRWRWTSWIRGGGSP